MSRPVVFDILVGAVAGAAATWLMDRLTTAAYEREPQEAKDRENEARGELTAYEIVAERAATAAGRALDSRERARIGNAIHWSLGVGTGAMYGLLRNRIPTMGLGSGVLFGLGVFALLDEGALPLMGVTPGPGEFPWQTHARGFAGHLVLGTVIELPFDLLDATTIREFDPYFEKDFDSLT